jgi:hypothetical protein
VAEYTMAGGWRAPTAAPSTSFPRGRSGLLNSVCSRVAEVRRDLRRWTQSDRTITAAVFLQLHCAVDPDHSRTLASSLVHQIDRVGARGHRDARPTPTEIRRASNAFARRGYPIPDDVIYEAMDAAWVRGWSV